MGNLLAMNTADETDEIELLEREALKPVIFCVCHNYDTKKWLILLGIFSNEMLIRSYQSFYYHRLDY